MKLAFTQLLLLVIIFTACKKHDSGPDPQIPIVQELSLIKHISVYDTAGTLRVLEDFYYDSEVRLTKTIVKEIGYLPDTIVYTNILTYSPSRVLFVESLGSNPLWSSSIRYYLNSSGLADSSTYISSYGPDSTYQRYGYLYNSDNQRTATIVKFETVSDTLFYHYSNKNVDSITAPQSPSNSKLFFSYDAGHLNTVGNTNAGIRFLGNPCQNPAIKAYVEEPPPDMDCYTYEFDQLNRISKITIKAPWLIPGQEFYVFPTISNFQVMEYTYY